MAGKANRHRRKRIRSGRKKSLTDVQGEITGTKYDGAARSDEPRDGGSETFFVEDDGLDYLQEPRDDG